MGAALPAENGSSVRQPVMKGGAIIDRVDSREIRCFIRDLDSQGAEISVGGELELPPEFLLYVPHKGVAYRASLRTRQGARAELVFSGTEPMPHWHYG